MTILRLFIVLLFLSYQSTSAAMQDDGVAGTDQANDDDPYEIVITGEMTRSALRNMIEEVEENFFARFNELNADDLYDVYCYSYTPTMSHISERVCEPVFQLRTRAENLSDVVRGLTCSSDLYCGPQGFLFSPDALRSAVQPDYETLQDKLEEMYRTDDDFRQIGNVLGQLRNRLENYGKD